MDLVRLVLKYGDTTLDEGRSRLSIQNVRFKSENQKISDEFINCFCKKENIDSIIHLTFETEEMYDFDVVPSFSPGAKSYYRRIKDGQMVDFVIKRLTRFPESKKAVMVFPNNDDYQAVLKTPNDDYLPCIVSIQFRLLDSNDGYIMNTVFNARSIDVLQKACGNFVAIKILSQRIANELSKNLNTKVICGPLDGLITDAHIYNECLKEAAQVVNKYELQT